MVIYKHMQWSDKPLYCFFLISVRAGIGSQRDINDRGRQDADDCYTGLMLGHCHRCWPKIKPALCKCTVFNYNLVTYTFVISQHRQ